MQALSVQFESYAPVKTVEQSYSVQGKDGSIQGESTFQKKLEQAQKEQDVRAQKTNEKENISAKEKETRTDVDKIENSDNANESDKTVEDGFLVNKSNSNDAESVSDKKEGNLFLSKEFSKEDSIKKDNLGLQEKNSNKSSSESISEKKANTVEKNLIQDTENAKKQSDNKNLESFDINKALSEEKIQKSDNDFYKTSFIDKNSTLNFQQDTESVDVLAKDSSVLKKSKKNDADEEKLLSVTNADKQIENTFQADNNLLVNNEKNINQKFTKDSKDKKNVITVIDERTANSSESSRTGGVSIDKADTGGNAEMSLSLGGKTSAETLAAGKGNDKAGDTRFSSMLSDQIQANANEFVKTGSIILRDNNSGTINLILHPEDLGNVKISLKLSDKVIGAQITVGSKEAYDAFKNSISSLKGAFESGGFETAGFDLTWSGSDSSQKQPEPNSYAALYEGALPSANANDAEVSNRYVNSYYSPGNMQTVNVVI